MDIRLLYAITSRSVAGACIKLNDEELDDLLPPVASEGRLNTLVAKHRKRNEVMLRLHERRPTLLQARAYLDTVLDVYRRRFAPLDTTARSIHSAYVALAVVKVQERI